MTNEVLPDCPPALLVVIVNYRTPNLTINCLRSLRAEAQFLPDFRAVVVDNASGDRSVEQISTAIETEQWGNWVLLLPLKHNGGYAFGLNAAIRQALQSDNPPAYFVLLNSDTQVRPKALQVLVDFMNHHSEVGIAGSSFEFPDGEPWLKAFRFPSILSEFESSLRLGIVSKLLSNWVVTRCLSEEACQVDWVCGAGFIVRREVFETVGLLDDGYFLWYEETDFCLRANRKGWPCWYVPQSRVMHMEGQSRKTTAYTQSKRKPSYWFDSRRRYFVKNYGLIYAALTDVVWIVGFSLWRIRRIIQRKPDRDPPQFLGDFIRNSVFFKGII